MAGVNKVILVGHLGKDPEVRAAQSGTKVGNVSFATTERAKMPDGEWGDKTEWHRLVFFGKSAETLEKFCKKGKQLYIEGRIQYRDWLDKESGEKKYMTEIVVNQFQMLGTKGEQPPDTKGEQPSGTADKPGEVKSLEELAEKEPPVEDEEDSLPF